ncbi:MAG: glycosyltransferase [Prolixibacteraceae bacterium]|jgi:glycosyltransferase involved in cell wall biosynthesis|nr:glycosyltransferase [Prolixibacteraceae bacterium]MDI9562669.1 glycosyltransferase [Bacteroidota bacterium]NLT00296.1 glycosyltransferase [Bacteroidales bacterium]OQB79194.1 MAG: Glycogen synthase [Bacteroidetes bacterium ADurb.Bin123]HNZ69182.1 glycosyltransferase [Prolixibacteraceae bacterium]
MNVLMFGWEFPPHISGGLGTACYGLTKGLSEVDRMQVTFVVPRAWGDELRSDIQLLGANQVPVNRRWVEIGDSETRMEVVEVLSDLAPYRSPEQFWELKSRSYARGTRFVEVNEEGKIEFSGSYGPSLYREIRNYAIVARFIARARSFDIIHAHDWLTFPAGIEAMKASGKPLVVHVHSTEFDRTGGNVNPMVYAIEREGMETADKVIAVSNLTRQTVIEKYGIDPTRVVTVYNAVEPLSDEEKRQIKKGIHEKIVTFMGRITYQKGPEYFIEAAALVLRKMKNVRFVMAGSGDMMDDMIQQAARLGITSKFHFTGFLRGDDVYRMLHLSDVFVMPSVSEPFGIVPLEAMQANVPVIISRQSGVAEILNFAIKVDFWDTFALADAIYALLNYPALARLFVKHGIEETSNLKWKNSANEVTGIYKKLLERETLNTPHL